MRNRLLVIFSVLILGVTPTFAFAEESVDTTTLTSTDATVTVTPTTTKVRKAESLKVRPTINEAVKDAKEEYKAKMMEARTEFKNKLSEIKDEKKQTIVTNIDSRISTINKNRTDEMYKRIERLTSILAKISTKEAALKADGKNTATLMSNITAAQTAIDAAKQAVIDQAAKEYVVNITTEAALKTTVSTTIKQFMTDIKAVFAKVVAAQAAVYKAHTELAKLMGVSPTPSTTTATPSPTTVTTP